MSIRDYLHNNFITVKSFAEKLDVCPDHISAIKNGRYSPSKKLAKSIERVTGGQIKAHDLRKDLAEKCA